MAAAGGSDGQVRPAIYFEPDGYVVSGRRVMGRQSAGNGFLRAAIEGRGQAPVTAYTPFQSSADAFRDMVAGIDPAAETAWIPGRRLDLIARTGLLYRPDQTLGPMARQRLRAGPAAYSLCGVTHTLATHQTLDVVAKIVAEPVMAWDALVCTSRAALSVVSGLLDEAQAQQRWRLGAGVAAPRPLLPVIPLGVHCADFSFAQADRQAARRALQLGPDDVAVLSAGRLSVNAKAHPYATLIALQKTAEATGRPIVLLFAGQAFIPAITEVFRKAAATYCPAVRTLFVDGQDLAAYRQAWAAADMFISMADSIQETFGLTPVEAMAAGLPVLVSDWNGYKDTVRDGVDGFRIATWTPPPGGGEATAADYESGLTTYDEYLYVCAMTVAVDTAALTARLCELVTDPSLRRRLGAAGQARARAEYDWAVVYRRYQELWAEQAAMRRKALEDPASRTWLDRAPRRGADHRGPFDTFAGFPSHHVGARTLVTLVTELTSDGYRDLIAESLLSRSVPTQTVFELVSAALRAGPASVEALAAATGIAPRPLMEVVARLAKLDLLRLETGSGAG
jgi:alpha-maltose-1-phosphate synthase